VTFSDLYAAFGIELHIVTVDVAARQPRVFNAKVTPGISVTQAVLASSAIPVAFRAGRLEVRDIAGAESVHRIMDGGVWANYPAFVFSDPSFRKYHDLDPLPAESITIGFTLDTQLSTTQAKAVAFREDMRGSVRDRGGFLPWILRYSLVRFYFMTVVPLVIAAQTLYTINAVGLVFLKDYALRDDLPFIQHWPTIVIMAAAAFDGFFSHFGPGYGSAILVLCLIALVCAVLGGTLLDSGISATRTLMAVGTDVPYWVGAASTDRVVRLLVPRWLDTWSFNLPPERVAEAVRDGRLQAEAQLPALLP